MPATDQPTTAAGLLAGATGAWTLDPATATVDLQTKAMWGLAKVKAKFKATQGSGTVAEDGSVIGTLVIDAGSVDTKSKKRDDHLRGGDFFEVTTYPTFTYSATAATPAADDMVKVTGTLTVHGQTRPLDVLAKVTGEAPGRVTVTADVVIDRSDWGVSWAKMGAKLSNQVHVVAQFTKVS